MVFKLIPVDGENSCKIELELGIHVFGRGKLLNVSDKRISRLHGQFEVTDDSLVLTALHQNPCFYQKSGSTQAEILRHNNSVSLNNGDKLGLLPTSHWFEVLQYVQTDEEFKETQKQCQQKANVEPLAESGGETDNEEESTLNTNGVANTDNLGSQSTEVLSPCEIVEEPNSNNKELDKETSHNHHAMEDNSVGSMLTADTTHADAVDTAHTDKTPSEPGSPSVLSTNQETEEYLDEEVPHSSGQPSTTKKRPHNEDDESDAVKKIKAESEADVKPDIKVDPDGEQAGSSNSNDNNVVKPTLPLRERCMFGASCYRRNPVHLSQYSHPRDADWGTGAKAPCPWGSACAKRDPRHWRDHDHPPGKEQPPPQRPAGNRKRKRNGRSRRVSQSGSESDRDDKSGDESDPQRLIVTGKRVRKPMMKADWIASDEDSDPFKTDAESDEWEPSTSEYTESQY